MILDEFYLFLKSAGRATNHADFSINYLGHSSRYYDYLRCSGTRPSLHSLVKLAVRLIDMAHEGPEEMDDTAAGRLAKRAMSQVIMRYR